jgi:hypothetical protein
MADMGVAIEGGRDHWETAQRGFLHAAGVDGGITGFPVDGAIVVDDLMKGDKEARSRTVRESKMSELRASVITRAHPNTPIIVVATRWHPEDPSGQLIKEGWEEINLPAICDSAVDLLGREVGAPLAPEIRPLDFLEQKKREIGDYYWSALYQGRPRPRGGTVFHEPHWYRELPRSGYVVAYGVDLAYTAKKSADHSVCLELWRVGSGDDAVFYVVSCDMAQVEAPNFTLTLKSRNARRPEARFSAVHPESGHPSSHRESTG